MVVRIGQHRSSRGDIRMRRIVGDFALNLRALMVSCAGCRRATGGDLRAVGRFVLGAGESCRWGVAVNAIKI